MKKIKKKRKKMKRNFSRYKKREHWPWQIINVAFETVATAAVTSTLLFDSMGLTCDMTCAPRCEVTLSHKHSRDYQNVCECSFFLFSNSEAQKGRKWGARGWKTLKD